jgi:CO/xanthine dehydrogenase FAD-binding subunit
VTALLALDASVELASLRGRRRLPIGSFVTGNRRTQRAADELITGIHVPRPAGEARATFEKLGARTSLVISIAMVAGVVVLDPERRIVDARVAVGACSPVAVRLTTLEARLRGLACGPALGSAPTPDDLAPIAPIDDVRGTAAYRRDAALTLVRRVLGRLSA